MECSCLPGDTHGRYTVHKSSRILQNFWNPLTGNRGDKLDKNCGIGQIQVLIDFVLFFEWEIRNNQSIHACLVTLFYKLFHAIMKHCVVIHHKNNRNLHAFLTHLFYSMKHFFQCDTLTDCLVRCILNDRTIRHRVRKRHAKFDQVNTCLLLFLDQSFRSF